METNIKKIEISSRLFLISAILICGIIIAIGADIIYKFWPPDYYREISVAAEGKVFAQPDIAVLELGVKTEGSAVEKVVKENTEKMNAILGEIKNLGVEEKDIQTTKYNLSPDYDWTEKGERIFKGYVLEQQINVKIRDFEKIGQIIEKATARGANLVGGLNFSIDNPEELRAKAREEAIKKAKEKANEIAKQSGIKLKKLVNIYEGQYYWPTRTESLSKESAVAPGFGLAPEIQTGQLEITVQVTLVYRIK
ncbi:MAG: SIMPL domain-containing protein [Minisyncoccales bacterium]